MCSYKSPLPGAGNSHTWPLSQRFNGPVCFWTYFRVLFPAKIESPPCLLAHSKFKISKRKTKRYQKAKKKKIIFRSIGFADWFVKDIQNSRQNRSKNKLVRENRAVTPAHGSCSLRVMGFWFLTLMMIQVTIIKKKRTRRRACIGYNFPRAHFLLHFPSSLIFHSKQKQNSQSSYRELFF